MFEKWRKRVFASNTEIVTLRREKLQNEKYLHQKSLKRAVARIWNVSNAYKLWIENPDKDA
jgi:hypothetical protein